MSVDHALSLKFCLRHVGRRHRESIEALAHNGHSSLSRIKAQRNNMPGHPNRFLSLARSATCTDCPRAKEALCVDPVFNFLAPLLQTILVQVTLPP